MIWVVAVAIFFMIVFTNMGARIGLANSDSLLNNIGGKWGKKISAIIGIGIFLVATSFQAGTLPG